MDENRNKNVTGKGKEIKKRGEGLGTGPVGRADAYAGRKKNENNVTRGYEDQLRAIKIKPIHMVILAIIAVILLILFLKFGGSLLGGNGGSPLSGVFSGFGGGASPSAPWNETLKNTGTLNTAVDSSARDRYTTLVGNGNDTVTIMVYMCGTDLESKYGMATNDINEMCAASLSDKINIIIYTGGCKQWKTQSISNSTNQIYRISGGKLQCLVSDDGAKVMTKPETLSYFIKYCATNYPASRNMLIFWDHGGGSLTGYGYDEKNASSGSMDLSGINTALKDGGIKYDFIGFDACLMATLETALLTSNYADYLIASEESEPGIGWYYTDWLNALSKNTSMSTIEIGKNIIDGFVDTCAVQCKGQQTTLSIVDLAELSQTVPDKLAAFSVDTSEIIKADGYKTVSDARAGTREFAASAKIDQVDLVNLADRIGTDEAKALNDAILSAIKYNRTSSNMTNAYGLSIYFPYKRAVKADSAAGIYSKIGMGDEYSKCIQSFAGMEAGAQASAGTNGQSSPASSLTGGSSGGLLSSGAIADLLSAYMSGGRSIGTIDEEAAAAYIAKNQFDASKLVWSKDKNNQAVMGIADDQWALIQSLQVNMFYDDGEGYIDLGLDKNYKFTEDGYLLGHGVGSTWVSIDSQPVAFYYETTTVDEKNQTVITGRVPAILNGERVDLILYFNNATNEAYIAGARSVYENGETEAVAKSIKELAEGDEIEFICDYYTYDGTYVDSYKLGDTLIYSKSVLVSDTEIEGDYVLTYLLTDIYNNEYWTPPVP